MICISGDGLAKARPLQKVLDALDKTGLAEDTIVVFTADHGDQVGAHGLFQKWYTAYQETIKVPLIVRVPLKFQGPNYKPGSKVDLLTSSVDILPTLLGLAGANTERLQASLKPSFTEVRPFPGRDLSSIILGTEGKRTPSLPDEPIVYMTDDNVLLGPNMTTIFGEPYDPVAQPNSIQTVIVRIHADEKASSKGKSERSDKEYDEKSSHTSRLWKYSRYFDNPQFWSNPGRSNTITINSKSGVAVGADTTASTVVTITQTEPLPDQEEMYDLTTDPLETKNLADPKYATPATRKMQAVLAKLLHEQVKKKCLYPSVGFVPGSHGLIKESKPIRIPPA